MRKLLPVIALLFFILPGAQGQSNQTVNSGSAVAAVNFTGTGCVYNRVNNNTSIGLGAGGTVNTASFAAVNTGSSPVKFTTGNSAVSGPAITVGPVTGNITACEGSASASPQLQQFTVSGNNLSSDITATTVAFFEISLNAGSGYSSSVTIPQTGGAVNNTIIYVRSSTSALAGSHSGFVTLSANGAANQTINVSSLISELPTVDNPGNQILFTGNTASILFAGTGNTWDWTNDTPSIGLAASGSGNIATFTAVNTGSVPVVATITVTPRRSGYAYIANAGANTVSVINTGNDQPVTDIPVGVAPYGVAVSPDGSRVYVSNITDNTVSVINTTTNTVITAVTVGTNPYGIAVSPNGSLVYVANEVSNTVSVIGAATNTLVATIPVGNYPTFTLVSPDGTRLYVGNQDSENISVFDTATNALIATIPTTGHEPSQMAISADGSTLYVVSLDDNNTFLVINTTTYATIASFSVGQNAHALVLTPDGRKIYVANNVANTVSVINTATNTVIATIPVGTYPGGVSVTSSGDFVYVVNGGNSGGNGTVSVISTLTNQVVATLPVGMSPVSIGNFITPGANCPGLPITFTITVNPLASPTITAGTATGSISACEGTVSASPDIQQFTVSGSDLSANVTVAAPPGGAFELSLNSTSGYNSSVTLPETGGILAPTVVYARSSATASAGSITGSVVLSSTGAADQSVTVVGTVSPVPAVNMVSNQTLTAGATTSAVSFTGTASAYNWVNDTPAIGLAANGAGDIAAFTAVNNTGAPITATITVTPVNTAGCAGSPLTFTITVIQSGILSIPNAFTPNGDGINDTWDIKYFERYPNSTVAVFNRWGQKLFSSAGYPAPWDGKYNGAVLPAGTYYYIIDLENGADIISGWVAIIR